jgi:hypothetical protein
MKTKILSTLLLCFGLNLSAQEYYWTSYYFNVDSKDIEITTKLTDDYFSQPGSKADGVTVYLFENHFKDSENNWSHQLLFTGTLDAMGEQYSRVPNDSWNLYLAKMGQYLKQHSAGAGNSLISYGDIGVHPVQNVLWLDVNDAGKFAEAWKKYHGKFNPKDRRVTLGRYGLGRSSMGETHYVLTGVNDFKTAFSVNKYREGNPAAEKAWDEFIDTVSDEVTILRSNTRIMLGKW